MVLSGMCVGFLITCNLFSSIESMKCCQVELFAWVCRSINASRLTINKWAHSLGSVKKIVFMISSGNNNVLATISSF